MGYTPGMNTTNSQTYLVPAVEADRTDEAVGFGVRDGKGRELGAIVSRWMTTWRTSTRGGCFPTEVRRDGATTFSLVCQAARGGARFGASRSVGEFATSEDREAAVAAYLKAARARAKKVGAS